jgi:hypothetical protein
MTHSGTSLWKMLIVILLAPTLIHYYTDQNAIPGNCFGNSQKVAIEEQIEYCEGFCKVNGTYILHGFNIFDNCVIDSTVQSNPNNFNDIKDN